MQPHLGNVSHMGGPDQGFWAQSPIAEISIPINADLNLKLAFYSVELIIHFLMQGTD